jgi:hypothetical protein
MYVSFSPLCGVDEPKFVLRDVMGDISFSGGFETMAAGKDTEGWSEMVGLSV